MIIIITLLLWNETRSETSPTPWLLSRDFADSLLSGYPKVAPKLDVSFLGFRHERLHDLEHQWIVSIIYAE